MLLVINSDMLHIQVLLVTGGAPGGYDSTEVYDPSVGPSWTARATLPRAMFGLSAAYIEDRVFIFGKGSLQKKKKIGLCYNFQKYYLK